MEEEQERPDPNYYITYEDGKWVLNILDPATKEVKEQKIHIRGYWKNKK